MGYPSVAGVFAAAWLAASVLAAGPKDVQRGDDYIIGIDDKIVIRIVDLPDVPDKPFRVNPSGFVDLPLLGPVRAAGLTPEQFKEAVGVAAKKYMSDPDISVNVAEYQSQMVTVVGAVTNPGSHPLAGPKRLLEVLSDAGGLRPDAGATIKITRESKWGTIPLPDVRMDLSGEFSVAELNSDKLMNAGIPRDNIYVRPHDVISVSKAELIYVLGQVKRAGGFPLTSQTNMSVVKALSLAEGWQPNASPKKSILLRPSLDGGPKTEIAVNFDAILHGKSPDIDMRANDVLYIPNNVPHSIAVRSAEALLQMGTGIAVWRF